MFVTLFWLLEMRGNYAPMFVSHILVIFSGGGSELFVTAVTRVNEKKCVSRFKGCMGNSMTHVYFRSMQRYQ